ncbi:hypothetical protein K438DRAFT_1765774 [Mycena galopus ATCC 62051]|nr:hypothetical protein K438DRAFT_1765774 [Mycena galopus ATCC 62051]
MDSNSSSEASTQHNRGTTPPSPAAAAASQDLTLPSNAVVPLSSTALAPAQTPSSDNSNALQRDRIPTQMKWPITRGGRGGAGGRSGKQGGVGGRGAGSQISGEQAHFFRESSEGGLAAKVAKAASKMVSTATVRNKKIKIPSSLCPYWLVIRTRDDRREVAASAAAHPHNGVKAEIHVVSKGRWNGSSRWGDPKEEKHWQLSAEKRERGAGRRSASHFSDYILHLNA